jgi:cyclic pyranopterin phosphate synthase
LRRHLEKLVGQLVAIPELKDLCLTTNGDRLSERIAALHATGLKRINVSIDTLDPEKFRRLTQRGNLDEVLKGIFAAKQLGLKPIKINAVIERGVNDDEILNLVDFSRQHGFIIRFIEYMDAGNANQWKSEKMVSKKEILEIIRSAYELKETDRDRESSPSEYFCFADGCGELGVIASVSEPFCMGCTRARLTVDGKLVTCLFSDQGHDLKSLLRRGASDAEVQDAIRTVWRQRKDRYSEERLVALQSQDGYQPGSRKKIEMIRLGG